jgi:outer membrane protein assembly factor BamB
MIPAASASAIRKLGQCVVHSRQAVPGAGSTWVDSVQSAYGVFHKSAARERPPLSMMTHSNRLSLVAFAAMGLVNLGLFTSSRASAGDWDRFRGPNGAGISEDKRIPVEIGEKKNRLWKVEIPGSGNCSPVVSRGKIFLQAASADAKERNMLCLALDDGRTLWKKSFIGGPAKTHDKNTLASCTAAADGTRVYMPFWNGAELSVTAFDYEGQVIWTAPLGPFTSQHGPGHSPIVYEGKVILSNDQDGLSELVALDAATGSLAWKKTRPHSRACYSTPLLRDRPGSKPELLIVSTAGASAYDPASGDEIWNWEWKGNDKQLRTIGAPAVFPGLILFGGGNGPGDRHTVALRLEGTGSAVTPTLAWETRRTFPYVPCMLTRGDHVYFVNDSGIAGCYVASTGKEVWTSRISNSTVTASPLMIDGKIYSISEEGSITVFAAKTKFEQLSAGALDEGVRATPAVGDGRLLVRGRQHLYCFGDSSQLAAK